MLDDPAGYYVLGRSTVSSSSSDYWAIVREVACGYNEQGAGALGAPEIT
jgi:hypothetical protein